MFSTDEFIALSRKFVCIRIETYENKEAEELVKKVLNGSYANTAFAIFNPEANRMLTRGGRSPSMALSNKRGRPDTTSGDDNDELLAKLTKIAQQFKPRGDLAGAVLQDFNSLRQALNCASADQRLLVFVNTPEKSRPAVEEKLQSVFADEEVVGRFHLDLADAKADTGWMKVLKGAKDTPSIILIRSGQFGLEGEAVSQLALGLNSRAIKAALVKANEKFAKVEELKNYADHVRAGRRQNVTFETEISPKEAGSVDAKSGGRRGR